MRYPMMKKRNTHLTKPWQTGRAPLHSMILLWIALTMASCYGEGLPLPPKSDPEPTPDPIPESKPAIDLSSCCDLFQAYAEAHPAQLLLCRL